MNADQWDAVWDQLSAQFTMMIEKSELQAT